MELTGEDAERLEETRGGDVSTIPEGKCSLNCITGEAAASHLGQLRAGAGAEAGQEDIVPPRGMSSAGTVEDVQVAVAEAVDRLRETVGRHARRLETLQADRSSCEAEETQLRVDLESKVFLVNNAQVL